MKELAQALKQRAGLRRRQGVVSAVDGATCTVLIGGSTVPVEGVQHLNSCAPQAGDVVWLDVDGADLWIIGTHGDPPPIDPSRLPAFDSYFTDADTPGAPAPVANFAGAAGFTQITLSWTLPTEALWRTWQVFEGTTSGFTPGTPILTTDQMVVSVPHVTGSGPWYYKVRAFNSRGEASTDVQVGPFTLAALKSVDIGPGTVLATKLAANAVEVASAALTPQTAGGDVDLPWHSCALDADGSVMLAAAASTAVPLYRSIDGATRWTKAPPAVGGEFGCAVNADGSVMLAGRWGGRLHSTGDGGVTWIEEQPAGAKDLMWRNVAVSGDGQVKLAGCWGGYPAGVHGLYLSVSSTEFAGSVWTEALPAGAVDKYWHAVAMSGDGQVMLAGVEHGRLYCSRDRGTSWNEVRPAGDVDCYWYGCAVSGDGSVMLAGGSDRLYLTTNSGDTWAETGPTPGVNKQWRDLSVSDDGSKFFASSRTRLWQQEMGYWTEMRPVGDVDGCWLLAGASGDGMVLLAGQSSDSGPGGRLYVLRGGTWAETRPAAMIAPGAISATEIAALSVIAGKIGAGAVTATEIAAGAITTVKLEAGAVTTNELSALAVTAEKIAVGTITADRLAAGSITAAEIAAGTITAANLNVADVQAGIVTAVAVNALTLNAVSITGGTIDGAIITSSNPLYGSVQIADGSIYLDGAGGEGGGAIFGNADGGLLVSLLGGPLRIAGALRVEGSIKPLQNWVSGTSDDGIWIQDNSTTNDRYKLYYDSSIGKLIARLDASTVATFTKD